MANKKSVAPETGIDELNDSLTKVTQRVQDNKKVIAIISVVVLAICALVLAYVYFFRNPAMVKSNDSIGDADLALAQGNDSIALVTYKKIADDGAYEAGNRANLNAAILLYQQGSRDLAAGKEDAAKKSFEEACRYAKDYDAQDDIIGAAAKGVEGDCLVNLDKLEDAQKAFSQAVKISDKNPAYTPYFMMKQARVLEALKNYSEQCSVLEQIKKEYPQYASQHRIDLDGMIELAKLRAAGDKK